MATEHKLRRRKATQDRSGNWDLGKINPTLVIPKNSFHRRETRPGQIRLKKKPPPKGRFETRAENTRGDITKPTKTKKGGTKSTLVKIK